MHVWRPWSDAILPSAKPSHTAKAKGNTIEQVIALGQVQIRTLLKKLVWLDKSHRCAEYMKFRWQ